MNFYVLTSILAALPLVVIGLLLLVHVVHSTATRVCFIGGAIVTVAVAVGLFSYWSTMTNSVAGMGFWYAVGSLCSLFCGALAVVRLIDQS